MRSMQGQCGVSKGQFKVSSSGSVVQGLLRVHALSVGAGTKLVMSSSDMLGFAAVREQCGDSGTDRRVWRVLQGRQGIALAV